MTLFVFLVRQMNSGVLYFWPVSVLLLAVLCLAVFMDVRQRLSRFTDWLCCLLPLTATALILLSGMFFYKKAEFYFLPYVLLLLYVVIAVVVIVKLPRLRLTAFASSLCFLWYSLWCALFAVVSITDNWL